MLVNMGKLAFAVVTVAVLVTVSNVHEILSRLPAYVRLHSEEPFYVVESIDKIAGACVCLLALWLMSRAGVRDVLRLLGLCASIQRALVFALIASSPMLLGFSLTRSLTPHPQLRPLLFLTVLSPIVEEIEFRGFGVLQLKSKTGWPFWVVVWPSALLSGYVHVERGGTLLESAGLFFLLTAGGRDVRVVGPEMAEPVGASGPACLHELVVGIVFRRQDGDWGLVPIHGPEHYNFIGDPYGPLLHARKNAGRDIAFLRARRGF